MKLTKILGWAGFAGLFLPIFSSCAHSPEGLCEGWVEDTCQTLSTCCISGDKFDLDACRIDLSASCQDKFDVELIHAGERVFNGGAAGDCIGSIESCADLNVSARQTYEQLTECSNAVTGYRPVGAACSSASECEHAGDFAVCFHGLSGASDGVCAKSVLAEDSTCSFSFETNELHQCPDGTYCDTSDFVPNPNSTPTVSAFEFSAPCKSYVGSGKACVVNNKYLACADGLYCDLSGGTPADAKCTPYKVAGATCNGSDECAAGLKCRSDAGGNGKVCTKSSGPYCYAPPVCGDGDCNGTETAASCPQDCGTNGFCGDGFCDAGEDAFNCPDDCAA